MWWWCFWAWCSVCSGRVLKGESADTGFSSTQIRDRQSRQRQMHAGLGPVTVMHLPPLDPATGSYSIVHHNTLHCTATTTNDHLVRSESTHQPTTHLLKPSHSLHATPRHEHARLPLSISTNLPSIPPPKKGAPAQLRARVN